MSITHARPLYPIGIQTFADIRKDNYLYIDKTASLYRMVHAGYRYVFLSRPRRFGKSMLLSTLQSYFEGRRELFDGLAIEKLETEWNTWPVICLNMYGGGKATKEEFDRFLITQIAVNEARLSLTSSGSGYPYERMFNLIVNAHNKYGSKVVILIDEYDAPLTAVLHDEQKFYAIRDYVSDFYGVFKVCDQYIRYCMFAGVTKIPQLSIFSALNNIKDISMLPEYASICGITKEELTATLRTDIELLATRINITYEQTLERLTEKYDGYHFAWPSPDILNPYSLMNAFSDGEIGSYWFASGTPTYVVNLLRKAGIAPAQNLPIEVRRESLMTPFERTYNKVEPILYQSGYLTIKDYDATSDILTLDIPNREVRSGLTKNLIAEYVRDVDTVDILTERMLHMMNGGNIDDALRLMQKVFGTLPYCDGCNTEGHYQQLLAFMFILLGERTDVEVHTPRGRVDIVMCTKTYLYLIELKLNQSAQAAMRQIDIRNYAERFALCGLPIVKVGINFSTTVRNITDWKINI